MWPDRVSNPGPLTYESGALLTALCGPVLSHKTYHQDIHMKIIKPEKICMFRNLNSELTRFSEIL